MENDSFLCKEKYYYLLELERQRIARDLHDSSLQNLTHIIQQLELSSLYLDNDLVKAKLEMASAIQELRSIIQDIRNTIYDLRPMTIDDLSFQETFISLIENMNLKYQTPIAYEIEQIPNCNKQFILDVYRIVQEYLMNAVKHADASHIVISIKQIDEFVFIQISDDGKGFDYNNYKSNHSEHFGLGMAEERIVLHAGNLEIKSNPGKGTTIKITFPINNVMET